MVDFTRLTPAQLQHLRTADGTISRTIAAVKLPDDRNRAVVYVTEQESNTPVSAIIPISEYRRYVDLMLTDQLDDEGQFHPDDRTEYEKSQRIGAQRDPQAPISDGDVTRLLAGGA